MYTARPCPRGVTALSPVTSTPAQESELQDTPATRGMVNKVSYMVQVLEEA